MRSFQTFKKNKFSKKNSKIARNVRENAAVAKQKDFVKILYVFLKPLVYYKNAVVVKHFFHSNLSKSVPYFPLTQFFATVTS